MVQRTKSASLFVCGGLVTAVISSGCASATAPIERRTDTCVQATADDIAGLYDRWNTTVTTAHPDKMTRLYASDATLLPANGAAPRTGYAAIRDYFVYMLQVQPRAEIVSRTIRTGCDMAIDTGVQIVSTQHKGHAGTPETEQQRYTLIYRRLGSTWLIEHHHASKLADGDDVPKVTKPARLPAVASYVRRATEVQRSPMPRPTPPAVPPASTFSYRSGAWSDGMPDFGGR